MTQPFPTREELHAWDRRHVWHPFTQMAEYESLLIERGEGVWLFDIDGNRYLDGTSSLWCNIHGHNHPRLNAALIEQIGKLSHATQLGAGNSTTVRFVRKLLDLAPPRLEHAFLSGDGATAVEAALKMAFQYQQQRPDPHPEKQKFMAFSGAYHGDTLGDVSVGDLELFHKTFAPLLFSVVREPYPDASHPPPGVGRDELLSYSLKSVETTLQRHHAELAACVIEPLVQGAAGMTMHPPGFLRGVRELTRKYDVLLIADEVAVGMGRTGTLFACAQEEVVPDFLCLAKGLTGGYLPLAAVLTTTQVWNAFLGPYEAACAFYHGHTYAGNPLGAAVALATLEVFEEERTLENLPPKIRRLEERLARLANHPHVGDVRQRGLIAGIELVRDKAAGIPYPWAEQWGLRVCRAARKYGILTRPLGSVLVVMPPLSITLDELDFLLDGLARAIDEVTLVETARNVEEST